MRSLHQYDREGYVAFGSSTWLQTSVNLPHPAARFHAHLRRSFSASTIVTLREQPSTPNTYALVKGFESYCIRL
jgi:hypothetical protein